MSFDFPGANTSFENHNVSEESFWPSFTDIMMVIVMVFLLITVSVIINNYHLVENLKVSMQAEQLSASIAEDTQVENTTLEEGLKQLQQQLTDLNVKLTAAKKETKISRSALLGSQQSIEKLKAAAIDNQQQLDDKTNSLALFGEQSKQQLEALEERSRQQLEDLEGKSKQQLDDKNQQIAILHNRQQVSLDELDEAKDTVAQLQAEESESKNKFSDLRVQMTVLQTTLDKTSTQFSDLKKVRESEETKLLSLQGEMDSLDKKYQKLLRPARSSKGKFVVSAMYSKRGGRSFYRLRSSPDGEYEKVSRKQLARKLAKLQKKHTTNLYVKIILPEKSGLSYNEAWRFTNEMQKTYDYYYQEEERPEDEGENNDATPSAAIDNTTSDNASAVQALKNQLDKAIEQ